MKLNELIKTDFTYLKGLKGKTFKILTNGIDRKITNNTSYCLFYKGEFLASFKSKTAVENYIDNLVRHNRLIYTIEL